MQILITGASGNVGQAIIKNFKYKAEHILYQSTRKKITGEQTGKSRYLYFDFDHLTDSLPSLAQLDILFLLRPPQISAVDTYFKPLIESCKKASVRHIVFLSVQGSDKASFIPHAKIEKLILQSGINYTFIRPAYFMQNLSTTLRADIVEKNCIYLPAGHAKFNWIDVEDIGLAIARILENPTLHVNKTYTLTGPQNLTFEQATMYLTEALQRNITYISPNLISFYLTKRKKGVPSTFILVMVLLHFLPRFQQEPQIHLDFKQLTGKKPNTLTQFILANRHLWQTKNPADS